MVIPKNLEECYIELDNVEDINEFLQMPEEKAIGNWHFSLGMWIRNNWQLWKTMPGGELSQWFNSNGVNHADDMSDIIFRSYYRHKHNEDIKLDAQFEKTIEYYLTDKQKLLKTRYKKLNKLNIINEV